MYPFSRFAAATRRAARMPALRLDETHVAQHTCLPWDIDPWRELNTGQALTLYGLGRMALMIRTGFSATLGRKGWGLAVAGASVRYRRRVKALQRFEMRAALVGGDERFFYIHQTMWRDEPVSSLLVRKAVTGNGIVATDRVLATLGRPDWRPTLPAWVSAWIEAEALRPWPPA